MATFLIGLVVLFVGAAIYGKFCEKVFGPDDRETPAYSKQDGVDYVPMLGWKNSLINLLNIAGTGPIIGPIQGILFGPIAFITIPIGNVIGGAMHDYFSGMICLRDGGERHCRNRSPCRRECADRSAAAHRIAGERTIRRAIGESQRGRQRRRSYRTV